MSGATCSQTRQWKPDHPILHIRTGGEGVLCLGQQNEIVIGLIDQPQSLNQFPGVAPDPDIKILEVPGRDDDLHDFALNRPKMEENDGPVDAPSHRIANAEQISRDGIRTTGSGMEP
jgi:hypothetical protein